MEAKKSTFSGELSSSPRRGFFVGESSLEPTKVHEDTPVIAEVGTLDSGDEITQQNPNSGNDSVSGSVTDFTRPDWHKNPGTGANREGRECRWCGERFTPKLSSETRGFYCSQRCRNQKKQQLAREKPVACTCFVCGKPYTCLRKRGDARGACSKGCAAIIGNKPRGRCRALKSRQWEYMTDGSARLAMTHAGYLYVDDSDVWMLDGFHWYPSKRPHTTYAVARRLRENRNDYVHHVIMGSPLCGFEIDHIDHNGLNNRRSNLRVTTKQQNHFNRKRQRGAKSQFKGLLWVSKSQRWHVRFRGKYRDSYANEVEAAKAWDAIAREEYGEYAYLNFPASSPALPVSRTSKGER